jgi:hypothetical protein
MKCFLLFIAGGLLFGASALGIGYLLWPDDTLVQGGTAFGLTFFPAAMTLAWVLRSFRSSPEMQLLASLGSSMVRMAVALGGGFMLTSAQAETFTVSFWYWLVLFYLGLLGFEIGILVRQPQTAGPAPQKIVEPIHKPAA